MNNAIKILLVLTSHGQLGKTGKPTGYYLPEVSHPAHVFAKAGYDMDIVSPKGGEAPMDPSSRDLTDPINKEFLANAKLSEKLKTTLRPDQVDPSKYAAIFFAGGHGTMWDLADNQGLQEITRKIYEQGGVVSAVCHGPAGLINVKLSNGKYLIAGKEISAFSNEEEGAAELTKVVPFLLESAIIDRGGRYSSAAPFHAYTKVSERLVTGQNPQSASLVAEEVVKLLK